MWHKWPTWMTLGGSLTTPARELSSRSISGLGGVFSTIFDTTVVFSVRTRKGSPVGGRCQLWAKWVEFSSRWVRGWHRLFPEGCLFYSQGCVSPSPFISRDKGGVSGNLSNTQNDMHTCQVLTLTIYHQTHWRKAPHCHFKNQFQCKFSRAFVRVWCL